MENSLCQEPRDDLSVASRDANTFLERAKTFAEVNKITIAEAIQVFHVLELERRNDLFVRDRDIFDEQMAGIGQLLRELIEANK